MKYISIKSTRCTNYAEKYCPVLLSRTLDHDLSKGTEPCPWIERYQYEQPPYQPQDLPWWPLPCSRMPGQDLLQHARGYEDDHLHTSAHHHLKRVSLKEKF